MIVLIVIVACLVVTLLFESGRRGRRSRWSNRTQCGSPYERHSHRPHLPGHGRRRSEAEARRLVINLLAGTGDPTAHLAAGVALLPGERSWQVARTLLTVWTQHPVWTTRSRIGWTGRTIRSVGQHETIAGWQHRGTIDWLITSERLAGRIGPNGELVSVWWSTIAVIDIDLRHARMLLQTDNGWRARLSGPGVASVAVAAVAACQGHRALTAHPGLAPLLASGFPQPPPRPTPRRSARVQPPRNGPEARRPHQAPADRTPSASHLGRAPRLHSALPHRGAPRSIWPDVSSAERVDRPWSQFWSQFLPHYRIQSGAKAQVDQRQLRPGEWCTSRA